MRLYSTLSRRLEELPPPPGPIGMYFCGPTVYQRIHVGNARPFVVGMWLRSWLRVRGYDARLVVNITDVNDKIYDAARAQGRPSAELAAEASRWYVEDTDLLGLGRPDAEPLATETMPEIVALIAELVERGLAYRADGDVYFRVAGYPDYGSLSGQRPDHLEEQEPNPRKEDVRDFALWKATKDGEDTAWESPWGRGRPGWHIECSAMAEKFLGPCFELHGGGLDLVFPHHENELAQSRGAGREFARIWVHNGMLRTTGEKMSKSLGNIATLREVVEEWGREPLLLYFMTALWRNPIDFSQDALDSARAQWRSFRDALVHEHARKEPPESEWSRLIDALDADFNTPDALALLHEWRSSGYLDLVAKGLELFGLSAGDVVRMEGVPSATVFGTLRITAVGGPPPDVIELAERRQSARQLKDFATADHLRDEILRRGWEARDESGGTVLFPRS